MSFSRFTLILMMLISLGIPQCAGMGDQSQVNEIVQDISGELANLFNQFAGAEDCGAAQQVITNLVGTDLCQMGGNSTTTISNIQCMEAPLTLSFLAKVTTENCDVGENISNGSYTVDISITSGDDVALVNGSNFIISGLNFSFNNFTVTQSEGGTATCSGTLTVDGTQCSVSSNCSNCPL
jgi:hypothetical protein